MAIHTGTAGSVVYNGTAGTVVGEMKNWTLDIAAAELDTSAFGSSWKGTDAGILEWSGSFEGNYDAADSMQDQLWTNLLAGTKLQTLFYVDDDDYFSGTAVLLGQSVGQSFDGMATTSFNFKGDGALSPPA